MGELKFRKCLVSSRWLVEDMGMNLVKFFSRLRIVVIIVLCFISFGVGFWWMLLLFYIDLRDGSVIDIC